MSFFLETETFLVFPVFFIERSIAPSASIAPVPFVFAASTALHKRRSFGLRRSLYNCLSVLVEAVQSLLKVLWVPVVTGGEIILYIHF